MSKEQFEKKFVLQIGNRVIFGIYKKAAFYWTGAAIQSGLDVSANSLLQWTAMQEMILQEIAWYETGEAFPAAVGGKEKGLTDFKQSFGGELYPFYRGRITLAPKFSGFINYLIMLQGKR